MKKYFTVSHLISFILGGLFWSIIYLFISLFKLAILYANGNLILE